VKQSDGSKVDRGEAGQGEQRRSSKTAARPDGVAHADGKRAASNNEGDKGLETRVEVARQVSRREHVGRLVVHDDLAQSLKQGSGSLVAADDEPVGELEPQRQHGRVDVVVLFSAACHCWMPGRVCWVPGRRA